MIRHAAWAALTAVAIGVSGCAAYHPVETTPEGIQRSVEPGDTVRGITRQQDEFRLLVTAIDDREMRGRPNGDRAETRELRFDLIESLAVQRPSMRRTLLVVVLPVVAGIVIACSIDDCRTGSTLGIER